MRKRKRSIVTSAGGKLLPVALALAALLLVSGTVSVEAQMKSYPSLQRGWIQVINPSNHAPYYLPYYDVRHWIFDFAYFNFRPYRCCRWYEEGYWYPWTWRWGRYDYTNDFLNGYWRAYGVKRYEEYGNGWYWPGGLPPLAADLKAGAGKVAGSPEPQVRVAEGIRREVPEPTTVATDSSGFRGPSSGWSGGRSSGGGSGRGKK